MTTGYAFVVGDLLHYGHLHFLRECKKYCDFLIVGVYTDKLATGYKRRPIIPFDERIALIGELKIIDKVIPVHHKDCTPALTALMKEGWKIDYLFHGSDWKINDNPDFKRSKEFLESFGGKLIQPKYYEDQSTTKIIQTIIDRHERGEF